MIKKTRVALGGTVMKTNDLAPPLQKGRHQISDDIAKRIAAFRGRESAALAHGHEVSRRTRPTREERKKLAASQARMMGVEVKDLDKVANKPALGSRFQPADLVQPAPPFFVKGPYIDPDELTPHFPAERQI
jgi:hypothetical protein